MQAAPHVLPGKPGAGTTPWERGRRRHYKNDRGSPNPTNPKRAGLPGQCRDGPVGVPLLPALAPAPPRGAPGAASEASRRLARHGGAPKTPRQRRAAPGLKLRGAQAARPPLRKGAGRPPADPPACPQTGPRIALSPGSSLPVRPWPAAGPVPRSRCPCRAPALTCGSRRQSCPRRREAHCCAVSVRLGGMRQRHLRHPANLPACQDGHPDLGMVAELFAACGPCTEAAPAPCQRVCAYGTVPRRGDLAHMPKPPQAGMSPAHVLAEQPVMVGILCGVHAGPRGGQADGLLQGRAAPRECSPPPAFISGLARSVSNADLGAFIADPPRAGGAWICHLPNPCLWSEPDPAPTPYVAAFCPALRPTSTISAILAPVILYSLMQCVLAAQACATAIGRKTPLRSRSRRPR